MHPLYESRSKEIVEATKACLAGPMAGLVPDGKVINVMAKPTRNVKGEDGELLEDGTLVHVILDCPNWFDGTTRPACHGGFAWPSTKEVDEKSVLLEVEEALVDLLELTPAGTAEGT